MNAVAQAQGTQSVAFCIEALTVGGAEQMLVAMANEFVARGWQVHMVCLTTRGELAERLSAGVTLHVLDKRPGADWRLPGKLRKLMKRLQPDVVNSHLWVANLWVRLSLVGSGISVIATEHSRDTWKPRHYRWLDRRLLTVTHTLVAVSADTADFYRHDIGVPDAKLAVINNGVDTQRYAAGNGARVRSEWASETDFLVGTVGRLVPAKNHHRLLDMAELLQRQIAGLRLVIVGDGPEQRAVEQAIHERGLKGIVTMAGARSDIPDVLAALDVFVLSSDREGHPLTALEAQAAGTPVVLTRAGGSADAIARADDQAGGYLVDKDAEALAEAVARLANDSELRRSMAEFAQSHALAHFDKTQMVDRYEGVFVGAGS